METQVYSHRVSHGIFALTCATFVASPIVASAQDTDQKFQELVTRARTAYGNEQYDDAVLLLQQAYGLQPDARLLINIAKTFEAAGDCVRAVAYYKAFLRSGETDPDLLTIAGKGATDLECDDYDPQLSGRLRVTSEPSGAKVDLDGSPLGTTPIETIALSAGERKLTIMMEGYADNETSINLRGERDEVVEVKLELPKKEDPKEDPVEEPIEDPIVPEEPAGAPLNIPAIALAGAGVVGLAVGATFDLALIPGTDEERAAFARTSPEYADLTEQRNGQANIAVASYVVGGLLLAGGAGWLVYDIVSADSDSKEEVMPVVRVAPVPSPEGVGFVLDARF